MEKINKKYNVSLGALIIFVAVSDLEKKDIIGYLKREFSIGDLMAEKIAVDLNKQIFKPLEDRLSFLDNNPRKDKKQTDKDRETIEAIFQKKINKEISGNPIIINAINLRIFYSLSRDITFKNELEKALLANNEKITNKEFIYKERQVSPNISNWIHYFLEVNGSEMFDNIVLSRFLVDSKNTKILSNEERKILKKVLNIYRNLKFFPDSMPNDDGEGWEIIPTGIEEYGDNKPGPAGGIETPKEIIEISEPAEVAPEPENKNIVPAGQDLNIQKILELEKMLHKFEANSLEAKVIEEEVKRLQAHNV